MRDAALPHEQAFRQMARKDQFTSEGVGLSLAPLLDVVRLDPLSRVAAVRLGARIITSLWAVMDFEVPEPPRSMLFFIVASCYFRLEMLGPKTNIARRCH